MPEGVAAVHAAVPQSVACPLSNTREVKLPEAAYGVTRSQSTASVPPPVLKSLTIASRLLPTARLRVVMSVPSTENANALADQSMR